MIAVDASVAVKWLVPEADEAAAAQLLVEDERLVAPSIIQVEVLGAVLRKFREKSISATEARAACERWESMLNDGALTLVPFEDFLHNAVELSLQIEHALPDCLYLAVAKQIGGELITADRRRVDRGKRAHPRISPLKTDQH